MKILLADVVYSTVVMKDRLCFGVYRSLYLQKFMLLPFETIHAMQVLNTVGIDYNCSWGSRGFTARVPSEFLLSGNGM